MTTIQFQNSLLGLHDRLYYYAISLTSSSDKAHDLTQDTMLKCLENRDKYRQNTNFKAWVYIIMKNTFINDYRRAVKKRKTFETNNVEIHMNMYKDYGYSNPESIQSEKDIYANIDSLDYNLKITFTMFLEGYKYKEIAEILGLPLGTVKSRIFFTRKKLESLLSEHAA